MSLKTGLNIRWFIGNLPIPSWTGRLLYLLFIWPVFCGLVKLTNLSSAVSRLRVFATVSARPRRLHLRTWTMFNEHIILVRSWLIPTTTSTIHHHHYHLPWGWEESCLGSKSPSPPSPPLSPDLSCNKNILDIKTIILKRRCPELPISPCSLFETVLFIEIQYF